MSTGSGKSGSGRSGSGRPGPTQTRTTQFSGRGLHNRVKPAKGRKTSSKMWLERQLNDPYVAEAKARGYRSRAAFKLLELDSMFGLLKKGARVVDLGSAPGGWTQVAVERAPKGAKIVAIDIREMDPVEGSEFIQMDFMGDEAEDRLKEAAGGPVDVVMSDMANSATGPKQTDRIRRLALVATA